MPVNVCHPDQMISRYYTANGLRGLDIIRGQTSKDDRALNVKYFGLDVHGHPAIHGPPPIALSGYHGTSETKDILWTSRLIGRVWLDLAMEATVFSVRDTPLPP